MCHDGRVTGSAQAGSGGAPPGRRLAQEVGRTRQAARRLRPVRDAEGAERFELFVVAAVLSIAVTRGFLSLTGYPQIGGSTGLHIAHVLFGGLGMVIALLLFMLFLGRRAGSRPR